MSDLTAATIESAVERVLDGLRDCQLRNVHDRKHVAAALAACLAAPRDGVHPAKTLLGQIEMLAKELQGPLRMVTSVDMHNRLTELIEATAAPRDQTEDGLAERELGFDFVRWCQDVTGVYVTTVKQGRAAVEGLVAESILVRELTAPDLLNAGKERGLWALANKWERTGERLHGIPAATTWLLVSAELRALLADQPDATASEEDQS